MGAEPAPQCPNQTTGPGAVAGQEDAAGLGSGHFRYEIGVATRLGIPDRRADHGQAEVAGSCAEPTRKLVAVLPAVGKDVDAAQAELLG